MNAEPAQATMIGTLEVVPIDGPAGAEIKGVCTEAGMYAIRADRDWVLEEDFMKAARKLAENKKLESKLDYSKV